MCDEHDDDGLAAFDRQDRLMMMTTDDDGGDHDDDGLAALTDKID